ncbi:MAG: cache domain-containing protein, partial [Candidatus Cloacimonetes bacterium]|nr:cache domain-containing protein [Candidatus Cloacimonadota bacterium]
MGKNRSKDALPDVLKPIPEGDSALMRKKNRTPTMVLAISIVVLSILGSGYLLLEAHQRKKSIQADLISIADIKATQIANWYNERYEDASQIKETVLLQEMAIEHLSNPGNKSNAEDLKKWALIIKQPNDYTWIALLNKQGEVVLSITEDNKTLSKFHNQYFHEVMSSGKIVMADLHTDLDARGEKASEVFMSFWIPVVAPQASNTKPQGVWLVQIDPTRFLYPLVQSWPVNTKTAETLLVRKEGSEVVFLNELRHQKNTAAKLRYKLADNPDLPAAKAVSGVEGLVESNDYRNVPVVSALRKVYGTPWYMIAKMDKQELYQPLKVRMWLSLLVAVILVLAIALTYGYMERQRDSIWLNQQLILQQAKAKLQQDYEHIAKEWQSTFDSISDVVWLLDTNWKIIRSNNYKAGSVPGVPEQIVG